ncbi:MAG TPA: ferritin-like domain-containing protein [Nocardioides sp.]|uniref:ferritin-like domain-containing protein n=1 Tax=Nocardioides sp. TaxID=35761 RepID=UPI002E345028|nr:ferritin-like domain-containing protein [Nocardioides sp.]HEX5088772.1 ferritin-like domain-containing protein [Nocardioides sp.]
MTTELDALQATLAAEHAAVYVLGLIGSRTSESAEAPLYTAVRGAYEAHRDTRDALIGEIAGLGATPSPAAVAYTAPAGLDTPDGRYQAALALEKACASTYAALVGATSGPRRLEAIGLLNDAAARELSFRGTPEIFPGADEYADR